MDLNKRYIEFIQNDVQQRGLVHDDLLDELVDHFCEMVERKMSGGQRFFEAYQEALNEFGADNALKEIQNTTIQYQQHPRIMLKNYVKIAWRNLQRHRFYSLINIFGLAIGVASSLLIVLFVLDEVNYDTFHKDSDRIYRIVSDITFGDNDFEFPLAPAPLGWTAHSDYGEIEQVVRIRSRGSYLVRAENDVENFNIDQLLFVDSTFFKVFSFDLIQGNPETVLKGPDKTVISKSLAMKVFGTTEVVGKNVVYDGEDLLLVTGVFEDMPANSHFDSDALISMETGNEGTDGVWLSNNFFTYMKLREGVNPKDLEAKFPEMVDKYVGPQVKQFTGVDFDEAKADGSKIIYQLQPLKDIHLKSGYTIELGNNGDIQYVYIFSAIAVFIILLACINFMNLSTARSSTRAREVGIRKVLGSIKGHLIRQFLIESIIITGIATFVAIGFAAAGIPFFNNLTGKDLAIPFTSPFLYVILLVVILGLGMAAGIYPSVFLSSFKPVQVLKGKILSGRSGAPIRSLLVIVQFSITIFLLLGTAAVYQQLNFIQNKKLGFNKEQVLLIRDAYMLGDQLNSFKNTLLQQSSINTAGVSSFFPIEDSFRSDNGFWVEGKPVDEENMVSNQFWTIDEGYIPTLGVEILEGRNFSLDYPSDSMAVILNETAAKAFGLDNPVGSRIQTFAVMSAEEQSMISFTVIGVVKDFHFNNMRQAISPLIFNYGRSTSVVALRFDSENTRDIISVVEDEWNKATDGIPFSYDFLDDEFSDMYRSEKKLGEIFVIFAALATIIGGLGLFGLAAYLTEQRTKEIGIRKVLGASTQKILWLVSRDFARLILISFMLAIPFGWYFINKWLLEFEYKTQVGWETYLMVGAGAFLIATLTISYQSIHAALTNPAETIRNE